MEDSQQTLSIAVIATDRLRQRCHAILARAEGPRVLSRGVRLAAAPRLLRRYQPSVLLLDAVESPLRALSALPTLRRLSPASRVILLGTDRTPREVILEGLRRGAYGHIAERDLPHHLSKAVRTVATRQPWLPRRLGAAIVAEFLTARSGSNGRPRTRLRLIRGGGGRVTHGAGTP